MPPITLNSIKITKQTSSPGSSRRRVLTSHGKVKSVGESYDGKHAEIQVAHGKKKAPSASKDNHPTFGDSQPESRIVVSKHHAKHFPVGGRVKISMTPLADDEPDGDEGE